MNTVRLWPPQAVVSVFVFALAACGSGSDTSSTPPSGGTPKPPAVEPKLSGMVALGAPVAAAQISARCSDGLVPAAQSASDGSFVLDLSKASLPCLLRAAGGRVEGASNELVLHSWASEIGVVHLNPLTELTLARAFAAVPDSVFTADARPALPLDRLQAALASLQTQLTEQKLGALTSAPFTGDSPATIAIQSLSSSVFERLSLSHRSLNDLVARAATGESWAPVLLPAAEDWTWRGVLPDTLVQPVVPELNPMSSAKVELGRFLFYDPRLSGNGKSSCSSCHLQEKAFTDGLAQSLGSTGEIHPRSALSLGNVAFNPTLTWAHASPETLEAQMKTPIFGDHPVEMGVNDVNRAEILDRLSSDAGYRARFASAFPGQDNIFSWAHVMKAISSFERTLLTGNSRYDQWLRNRGPELNESERRGGNLFFASANCFRCHGNFNFTDTALYQGGPAPELRFHNTGLFNIGGTGAFPAPNRGLYEITGLASDMGKFRAPSLRNIAVTGPYMHDGSIATLEEVLDFYAAGGRHIDSGPHAGDGRTNPYKSDIVNGSNLDLTAQDKADIIAFLRTLTDEEFLSNPKLANPFK